MNRKRAWMVAVLLAGLFGLLWMSPSAAGMALLATDLPNHIFLPLVRKDCPGNCYYVSSSTGNDANSGRDPSQAFKTLAKVNSLALGAGDRVLFQCGDVWRGEMLMVTQSGQAGNPILFSTYPEKCANQPVIDGTQPVSGWTVHTGNIYVSDLGAGANATRFRNLSGANTGINQLFRDGQRLTMGRWPNLDADDGGYATVDAQPSATSLTDAQLPGNLAGGTVHLKVIRWSMVNRDITAKNGTTLTLNQPVSCYNGTCAGWGYFINNHLNTLDQDGEWYYDKNTRRVYLYSTSGNPGTRVEASLALKPDDRNWGLITLGVDLDDPVHDVVIDNLAVRGSWLNGIASPTNLHPDENRSITLSNNHIFDVDDTAIDLWSWVWGAADGVDGWRGGNNITIQNNLIEGANHFGIHTPSRQTVITGNTIRNIALIANLNESGMGCGKEGGEGQCTECGAGLRIYTDKASRSGYGFTIQNNRFERTGYNGIQTFGSQSEISGNVFVETCYSKGDCGAINTYGNDSLDNSNVHDIQILNNLILNTIGNTDGTASNFRTLFGFGIYLDHYSRNITVRGNTVAYSTATGILYQDASGVIENNISFQNGTSGDQFCQVALISSQSTNFSGNLLLSNTATSLNLCIAEAGNLSAADYNRYYHTSMDNFQVVVNNTNYNLAG
ncbi:MAG: right-handed parallel beta-helix repeat-containing protein, partial [Anaerolineae bacterium]|nr:right-handed parallel beta-helix repeat-containing protein [Anaerolineae bacterium]